MTHLHVTFDGDDPDVDFPLEVRGIGEFLFEQAGGNLVEMSDKEKRDFEMFVADTTAREAINQALEIADSAPTFDHVSASAVDRASDTVTVEYTIDQ
jgi:hypothetical protein